MISEVVDLAASVAGAGRRAQSIPASVPMDMTVVSWGVEGFPRCSKIAKGDLVARS